MGRRTLSVKSIRAHTARKPEDQCEDLSNVDGTDLLAIARLTADEMQANPVVDHEHRTTLSIEVIESRDRHVLVRAEPGTYGETAVVRDVRTGTERFRFDPMDAHIVSLRCMLWAPEGSPYALAFCEHGSHRSGGSAYLKQVHADWVGRDLERTLKIETITKTPAWIEAADLLAVQAVVYGHRSDYADNGRPEKVGVMTHTLTPEKGTNHLSSVLKRKLLGSDDVSRSKLLGIEEDLDEVRITLGDGGQSKTMVVGRESTPAVTYMLNDYDQDELSDSAFMEYCHREAQDLLRLMTGA